MIKHIYIPDSGEFYHMDESFLVYTCDCKNKEKLSLCLSLCACLKDEGELRNVKRQIAQKRKELGLLAEGANPS